MSPQLAFVWWQNENESPWILCGHVIVTQWKHFAEMLPMSNIIMQEIYLSAQKHLLLLTGKCSCRYTLNTLGVVYTIWTFFHLIQWCHQRVDGHIVEVLIMSGSFLSALSNLRTIWWILTKLTQILFLDSWFWWPWPNFQGRLGYIYEKLASEPVARFW